MSILSRLIITAQVPAIGRIRVRISHSWLPLVPVQISTGHVCAGKSILSQGKVNLFRKFVTMPKENSALLAELRALMKNLPSGVEPISAYIIPTDDAHQSEYICAHDERRAFISCFDGSSGTAVVTDDVALLWTDGRYYQQAETQLPADWILMKDGQAATPTIGGWLSKNLAKGARVGVDPNLMNCGVFRTLEGELEANENVLVPINENLIDLIWKDQPSFPCNKIISLPVKYTGMTIAEKIAEIRGKMEDQNATVLVVTALDEVAWFLNMRGSDIDYNPVFFAYVLVTKDELYLFVDEDKLPSNYVTHFEENGINVILKSYSAVHEVLTELVAKPGSRIWISAGSSYSLCSLMSDNQRIQKVTPICHMKAIKNDVEAEGMRQCHIRDGVALCKYFAWLENTLIEGKEVVTEISGADKLEAFRAKQAKFMGLSFPTINGFGANGSVIHYHPKEETNKTITTSEIYLCDSGAQFMDGTTDVTRTWHFGTPTPHQMECYTRVLKGQITMATTIFPTKVIGRTLDTLARKALWDVGLDYAHGTGHGIGHFLNVHEGPMGIGIRPMPDDPGLQANMFVSNEPGYYEDGQFGIRIEDIVQIVPADSKFDFAGRGALTFKTITMCPIQTKMIVKDLMTEKERQHLNNYHQIVRDTLGPIFKESGDLDTLEWLHKETNPI